MTSSSHDKQAVKTAQRQAVHLTTSEQALRISALLIAVVMGFICLQSGTAYFTASRSAEQVESWFTGNSLPEISTLQSVQKNLESVDTALLDDASVKIALAKLYIVRAQTQTSDVYYEAARKAISDARLMQPSHFEALALQVFLDDYLKQNDEDTFAAMSTLLDLAPYEKNVQQLVGPIMIKRWYELPDELQQAGEKLMTSALREPETREQMLSAMARYKVAAPFSCCSPNKATSARLRMLEAKAANATYQ